MDIVELHGLRNDIQRRCHRLGVTVTFDPDCQVPFKRGTNITLPRPNNKMSADDISLIKGWSIHEPLHMIRDKTDEVTVGVDNESTLFAAYGCFSSV